MEFLLDPSILIGLLALVVLEIVLGIDNLVFRRHPYRTNFLRLSAIKLELSD